MKQPFFSVFFSLSSHHPFRVPDKHKHKFREGKLPIHKSIQYTDYALGKFMKTASSQPWFNNTIFVFTADHTGAAGSLFYENSVGAFQVPILFYVPGNGLKSKNNTLISHCDLMPTLLRYLGYEGILFSFGTNALDTTAMHYNINLFNNNYQLIENEFIFYFNGEEAVGLFNIKEDPLLQHNLFGLKKYVEIKQKMEKKIKAIVQTYNYSLIHNTTVP